MDSLVRASAALVWRIAFATAAMPVVILSAIVRYYPIATVGTLLLLAGAVIASAAAIVSMVQVRGAQRGWLIVAAIGIALWAGLDVTLFRAVWLYTASSAERLPSSEALSTLMWFLPPAGMIGVLVFAWVATPASRSVRVLLLLLFGSWIVLHHRFFFHREVGLVGIKAYADHGLWAAGIIVIPIALLFLALSITLLACATRITRQIRNTAAQPLPAAIARARSDT